jgi:hypothetical protein
VDDQRYAAILAAAIASSAGSTRRDYGGDLFEVPSKPWDVGGARLSSVRRFTAVRLAVISLGYSKRRRTHSISG